MKNKAIISSILFAGLTCIGQSATTILNDTFTTANVNGSVPGWTKIGSNLFGGIGVETNVNYPTGSGSWAYFQTNATSSAGMFRSTGVTGSTSDVIKLTFDLGGNNSANLYSGTFTASIWDGSPTGGGTQLATITPANPAGGVRQPIALSYTLTTNTTNDIYVRFNASNTSAANGGNGNFNQAIIDNVLVTVPEPSTALLGALGALCLLRRRR